MKGLETRDWQLYRDATAKFCKERAIIVAIKAAAEMVKTGKVPEGGFTQMFDEAMKAGQTFSDEDTGSLLETPSARSATRTPSWAIAGAAGASLTSWAAPAAPANPARSCRCTPAGRSGREAFGIKPRKALEILCIQGENDKNDMTDMAKGVVDGLGFSKKEKQLLDENTVYVRHNKISGPDFLSKIARPYLDAVRPDLFHLDPLNTYWAVTPAIRRS